MREKTGPQVWTSETSATRALTALGVAHPGEFSAALNALLDWDLSDAAPASFRCEWDEIDLVFSDVAGAEVFIEAKIDHYASTAQIDDYRSRLGPGARPLLLVPRLEVPDVEQVLEERPDVRAITWAKLLERLALVNPVAGQLCSDVYALADLPGTKAKVRQALNAALRSADTGRVRVEESPTTSGYPSLNVTVPGTWVLGQVEATRPNRKEPRFTAKVGFATGPSDESDEGREKMREALHKAWAVAASLEEAGKVELSRHRGRSKQHDLFGTDEPYQARGYRNSHAGVATVATPDAGQALSWAVELAAAFEGIARESWQYPG